MKKKTLIASIALSALVVSGAALLKKSSSFINKVAGEDTEYQIVLDSSNGPTAGEYTKTIQTAQGNDFTMSYQGTHSVEAGYHTVLSSSSMIKNYSQPIDHLQTVVVNFAEGGGLTLKGGHTATGDFYETHSFSSSGSYTFTDDVNYFQLIANVNTKIESVTLKYSDACLSGSQAVKPTIGLEIANKTMEVGGEQVVTATSNSKGELNIYSSNTSVVTTSKTSGKSGTTYKIQAVGSGTAKVYAQTSNGLKSDEITVTVITAGLPDNCVGFTYRFEAEVYPVSKFAYIRVSSATELTFEYDGNTIDFEYDSVDGTTRTFYDVDTAASYLDIVPASNGNSLEVFGLIYDENYDTLAEFGNPYTNTGDEFTKYVAVSSVSLDQTSKNLDIGENFTLTATVNPTNATEVHYVWSSSNSSVASVTGYPNKTQKVTAVASGSATITVYIDENDNETKDAGEKFATCVVTVNSATPVTSVTISGPNEVEVNKTITLTATVLPENATNKTVSWASSDTTVATINASTGVVTGKKVGTTKITATADGITSAQYTVTVTAASATAVLPDEFIGSWFDNVYYMEFEITEDSVSWYDYGLDDDIELAFTGEYGLERNGGNDSYRFANDDESMVVDITAFNDDLEMYVVVGNDDSYALSGSYITLSAA